MFGRNHHDGKSPAGRFAREPGATRGDAQTTTMTAPATERDEGPATTEPATTATPAPRSLDREDIRVIRARQRSEFGGMAWGSAFFGWLVAFGMAALLSGLIAAAGTATGLTDGGQETIGLAGGIALLVAASIAYFCGGYVAGRLARFDGARNGLGVWVIGLLVTAAVAALAVIGGSEYNVIDRANLPRLTVGEETATTAGVIAMGAILVGTLLAAIVGGKAGERFHRKVDAAAIGRGG